MPWTKDQSEAIYARNPSILVSAAAGSGKSTVLMERVKTLLTEGMQVDRMLIVTFTRAAAAELRAKLINLLDECEDEAVQAQSMMVNRADICTLHVFCSRVIREHFQAAGIDPMSRIPDTSVLEHFYTEAIDEILEAAYLDPDPDEDALFSSYKPDEIVEFIKKIREFLLSLGEAEEWIDHVYENRTTEYFLPLLQKDAVLILSRAGAVLEECDRLLDRAGAPLHYEPALKKDQELLSLIREKIKEGSFSPAMITFKTLPRAGKKDDFDADLAEKYRSLRDSFKSIIKKLLPLYPENMEQLQQDLDRTLPQIRALITLARRVDYIFTEKKRKKNYLDYSDLEHLCLKALEDERVRKTVQESYDAIFVDEYQDISAIQEKIIRSVTGKDTCLFMVGDVKQSIYRFRLAEPTLFQQKYKDFSIDADAKERKIILQQNFRSTENIIHCVNNVFSHAMRENVTELEYDKNAFLNPSETASFGPDTEFVIIHKEKEESGEESELKNGFRFEANWIAKKISSLVSTGLTLENGLKTPVRYCDIAILLRNASGRAPVIGKILSQCGIPVYSDADAQFYDLPQVNDILSVLQVLDNPMQDIPLLSALHCPCFNFSEEELARIRMRDTSSKKAYWQVYADAAQEDSPLGQKIRSAQEKLAQWRFLSKALPVESLIREVMDTSGLYMRAGAMKEGALRQGNMRMLCEQALLLEDPYDLSAFLQSVKQARKTDDSVSTKSIGENEDVVRVMTIHKSKGLQFPIVFVMELARDFRTENAVLQLDRHFGAGLQMIDGEKRIKRETLSQLALSKQKEREQRAEECRLLYVAMTRAKEKLYLLCSVKKPKKALESWLQPRAEHTAGSATNMAEWIAQSIQEGLDEGVSQRHTDEFGGKWQILWEQAVENETEDRKTDLSLLHACGDYNEETAYWMERKLPPFVPLKVSVTAISKKLKNEQDMDETPEDKRKTEIIEKLPAFISSEKVSGVQRGTVTHKVLGCIDYDLVRADRIDEAIELLCAKGLISQEEYRMIRSEWIRGFFSSPLGKKALNSPECKREWAFNLLWRDNSILQGVIDLCFIEKDGWILADYKTDRLSSAELKEKYTEQLNWYRYALEKITNLPVKKMYLFSLYLSKAIPVTPFEPAME